jgi:hypothetical protein
MRSGSSMKMQNSIALCAQIAASVALNDGCGLVIIVIATCGLKK